MSRIVWSIWSLILVSLLPSVASATPPMVLKLFFNTTTVAVGHPHVVVTVPPPFKLIGGGAQVIGTKNILTGSFPAGNTWVVDSKDADISSPATVAGIAIGLYDATNLWTLCPLATATSVEANRRARAVVPANCVMTGGGARANITTGPGIYLTASYPDTRHSWLAAAKEHLHPDSSSVTAFAIGIRPTAVGPLPDSRIIMSAFTNGPVHQPSLVFSSNVILLEAPPGFKIVGGGAVDYWGGAGNMLTGSNPMQCLSGWGAVGTDHITPSPATLGVSVIVMPNVTVNCP